MTETPARPPVWTWKDSTSVPIGLGGSVFGWIVPPDQVDAILDRFFEIGGRVIDTSDGYSYARRPAGADSESLIGSWVRRRGVEREIRIITKVGLCPGVEGLAPPVIARAVDASLARLGIAVAEAILAHADDGLTSADEVAEGLAALRGTHAHHIGVSGFGPARLASVQAALRQTSRPALDVVQEEFSLAERGGLDRVSSPLIVEPIPAILCSAGLARGFLTGKFQNANRRVGARQGFVVERYQQRVHSDLLEGVRRVAREHGVTPAAVALRWLLQHDSVVLPLASVTRPNQLDAFEEVTTLTLSSSEWGLLNRLSLAAQAREESSVTADAAQPK